MPVFDRFAAPPMHADDVHPMGVRCKQTEHRVEVVAVPSRDVRGDDFFDLGEKPVQLSTHRDMTHASILRRAGRRRIGGPPTWHPYETSEGGCGASAAAAATAAASARLRTPSFASTRPTWCSTVFTEMKRRSPISGVGKPGAQSPRP